MGHRLVSCHKVMSKGSRVYFWPELLPVEELSTSSWPSDDLLPLAHWWRGSIGTHINNSDNRHVCIARVWPSSLWQSEYVCVCVHVSGHLCLRDELCDLLAGVERCNFHVSHTPVSSTRSIQDLVMFLQDFTETSEIQILWTMARKTVITYSIKHRI